MAQRVKDPVFSLEGSGSILGLVQGVKDLAFLQLWCRLQTRLGSGIAVAVV